MRIVIDARHIADHFPGIGRYVYSLLTALAALEHRHEIIAIHHPGQRNTRYDLEALSRAGIRLHSVAARPFSTAEQWKIPTVLHQLGADCYHAPYYVRPYTPLPCPSITTLYDIIPRLFPGEVSPHARLLFDLLTRRAIRASERIITISQSARADLQQTYRLPTETIAVTPLATDPHFRPQPYEAVQRIRDHYRLTRDYVLCVSSNKPHKRLMDLVDAWRIILERQQRTTILVIAGQWDSRYPEVQQAIEHWRLRSSIRLAGAIPEADLPALYSGALLFAFPSHYEGFGLPPLEALACGTPVICGNRSSLPEVVGEAARILPTLTPITLAAGIEYLINHPEARKQLRAAGLTQAAQFSWQRTAQETLRVYESLQA